jgi:D-alanyl-lipoteichoic acid acyltransferase DltB (MBOAT superfamily)
MTLTYIVVFIAGALLYAALTSTEVIPARGRGWALLVASILAIYLMQPPLTIRFLDFILPTITLVITIAIWLFTRDTNPVSTATTREDKITFCLTLVLIFGLSLTRFLAPDLRPTPSRPPDPLALSIGLLISGVIIFGLWRFLRGWRGFLTTAILLIVVLFVILKTEVLATSVSALLRTNSGQKPELANAADLSWLGISYIAFRLIHILREKQLGRLPALSLREHLTYVIFFPALASGPIDRAERFTPDLRALPDIKLFIPPRLVEASGRISMGLFKKFILADSLALFALNSTNAAQATSAGALWLLLYAYAFRLYLDFSGYTDIVIGIGILLGVRLPENFDLPYLKQSITAFWQSWHITLSNWVRFYVFSPLSRTLLRYKVSSLLAVFIAQMATMLIIGLWHGVQWTFIVWGVWHGIGLFVHKVWSDHTRKRYMALKGQPRLLRAWTIAGILLTFHFVVLGWVWFALPDIGLAAQTFGRLFGIGF